MPTKEEIHEKEINEIVARHCPEISTYVRDLFWSREELRQVVAELRQALKEKEDDGK